MSGVSVEDFIATVFGIFCRIGACMVVLPGFSGSRIPIRIRLLVAFGLSAIFIPNMEVVAKSWTTAAFVAEIAVGLMIGLACRIYLVALEFVAVLVSNLIGLSALSVGLERDDLSPSIAMLVTACATYLLIELGVHVWMLDNVVLSYSVFPVGHTLVSARFLDTLIVKLRDAFMLCLQFGLPFVVFSLLTNTAFGMLGKLIPQVQTFFVSIPFLAIGGLLLAAYTLPESLFKFGGIVMGGSFQ